MYNILLLHVKYSYNFLAAMNKYEYSHNMLYKNSNASVGILQFVNFVCVFIFRIKDYPFCTVGLFSDKESKETRLITMRSKPEYVEFVLL